MVVHSWRVLIQLTAEHRLIDICLELLGGPLTDETDDKVDG